VFLYGLVHLAGWRPVLAELPGGGAIDLATVFGLAATLLGFALFVCTGMIYACLPFLREWHSPLTPINFLLLGCTSGFTLAAAFSTAAAPELTRLFTGYALAFTLLGLAGRGAALIRNRRLKPKSTLQTAIGIKHPRIAQKSMGFQSGSFNTREFFHGRPAGTLRWVKWAFLTAAFVVPALLLVAALFGSSAALLALAFVVQFAGLVAERWFFFAEANHPQNLYYQAVA
jgi:DMSO reductase anchor subunit